LTGNRWIIVGSVSAAIAVAMGALGAHGLENWLGVNFPESAAKRLANWKTGATYQIYHSLGMILVGLLANFSGRKKLLNVAGVLMLVGILLFSGMLYAWVITDNRTIVMIVPLGGLSFILGWVTMAIASFDSKSSV
jgi:uncharacterized membrane protein YgdD (TMEM256/DUF423 family)